MLWNVVKCLRNLVSQHFHNISQHCSRSGRFHNISQHFTTNYSSLAFQNSQAFVWGCSSGWERARPRTRRRQSGNGDRSRPPTAPGMTSHPRREAAPSARSECADAWHSFSAARAPPNECPGVLESCRAVFCCECCEMLWKYAAPWAMLWNVVKCCEIVAHSYFTTLSQHFTTLLMERQVSQHFTTFHNKLLLSSFSKHPGIRSGVLWSLRASVKRLHTWNRVKSSRSATPRGHRCENDGVSQHIHNI